MKELTIVSFRAYDRDFEKTFIDKSFEQIHTALDDICHTYVVSAITIIEVASYRMVWLEELTKFQNK